MEVRRLSTELYHHGKDGQKWGVMHGPPYPLDSNASTQAKKKKKSLIARYKDKKKMKAVRKAKEDKKKEQQAKETLIKSGSVEAIKKYQRYLTDDELKQAVERVQTLGKLDEYTKGGKKEKTTATGQDYVSKIAKTAANIGTIADATSKTVNAISNVQNFLEKRAKDD